MHCKTLSLHNKLEMDRDSWGEPERAPPNVTAITN